MKRKLIERMPQASVACMEPAVIWRHDPRAVSHSQNLEIATILSFTPWKSDLVGSYFNGAQGSYKTVRSIYKVSYLKFSKSYSVMTVVALV